jgi:hypothetical protein
MSGNYQSRVFSFISKRTNQLRNTCVQGLRHLKVAVVWSGQILLYPLQLLAQSAKIIEQLPTPIVQRSLPEPSPDISIEQALELVVDKPISIASTSTYQDFDAESALDKEQLVLSGSSVITKFGDARSRNLEHYDPATADWEVASYIPDRSQRIAEQKPIVRGLSSLLIDRQLVLVTIDNEVLEILTVDQQQEIRRRIGIDLAVTWHQWHTGTLPTNGGLVQHQLAQPHYHSKQLAIAADEDHSHPGLLKRWQDWLQSFQRSSDPNLDDWQELNHSVGSSSSTPQQLLAPNYPFTPQPPQISRWLDLPQLPPIIEDSAADQNYPAQTAIGRFRLDWIQQVWSYYRDYLSIPAETDLQIIDQPAEFQLIPLSVDRSLLAPNLNQQPQHSSEARIETAISKTSSSKTNTKKNHVNRLTNGSSKISTRVLENVEYQPDWIETTSESIGYNQSLIAKFLAWLDRLFLNLENWLIHLWEVITNHPSRN